VNRGVKRRLSLFAILAMVVGGLLLVSRLRDIDIERERERDLRHFIDVHHDQLSRVSCDGV
jgi:hypothetical protein